MEIYATRLAEVELRAASPDEEHRLIADYCHSLEGAPASPGQLMMVIDEEQRAELQEMIRELETENQALRSEYEQLQVSNGWTLKKKELFLPFTTQI